jgi:hypothetical protein
LYVTLVMFESIDRCSLNLVWTLCYWRSHKSCTSWYPSASNMSDPQICEVQATLNIRVMKMVLKHEILLRYSFFSVKLQMAAVRIFHLAFSLTTSDLLLEVAMWNVWKCIINIPTNYVDVSLLSLTPLLQMWQRRIYEYCKLYAAVQLRCVPYCRRFEDYSSFGFIFQNQ